jgi:hypothetical protein
MTKSIITRERLQEIAEDGFLKHGESKELARMALAAMDSEPVACGNGCSKSKWHKMALDIDEYMNGEDARESKGRDEIYSEIILRLTRLDVLETILRNEIGLPYGSPIPDIAEKIYDIKRARIYSVVPEDVRQALSKMVDEIIAELDAEESACRAAMLQAEPVTTANKLPETQFKQVADLYEMQFDDGRTCAFHTDAEKAVQWLNACDGNKVQEYVKLERLHDAVSGNSPVIPDTWIPVSERLPEEGGRYWCYVEEQNSLGKSHYQWNCSWNGEIWSDAMMHGRVTHWMPLPAAPQEVGNV